MCNAECIVWPPIFVAATPVSKANEMAIKVSVSIVKLSPKNDLERCDEKLESSCNQEKLQYLQVS